MSESPPSEMYEIDSPELRVKEENDMGNRLQTIRIEHDKSIQDISNDVSPLLREEDRKRVMTPGYGFSSSDVLTSKL